MTGCDGRGYAKQHYVRICPKCDGSESAWGSNDSQLSACDLLLDIVVFTELTVSMEGAVPTIVHCIAVVYYYDAARRHVRDNAFQRYPNWIVKVKVHQRERDPSELMIIKCLRVGLVHTDIAIAKAR